MLFFLSPGTYNLPFEFPEINTLLPSFEFHQYTAYQCHLRYIILAELSNNLSNIKDVHQTETMLIIKSFSTPF